MSFNILPLIEGLVSPEFNKPKGVFLRVTLVSIGGVICILASCISVVSVRIIPRYGIS